MDDMDAELANQPELTRQQLVDELTRLLDVEQEGDFLFRGLRKRGGVGRVYGGQVVAQALAAASKTVDPSRKIHSLHSYFLRGGSEDYEIEYRVEADFDGRSFSNRRVIAMQQGKVIFNLAASFQGDEPGREHHPIMPVVEQPENLPNIREYIAQHPEHPPQIMNRVYMRPSPIEVRCIGIPPFCEQEPGDASLALWFRAVAPVTGAQWMHRAIIAYASDFAMITTALRPHGLYKLQAASIDHSLWFHRDMDVNDWLLYTTESPWAGNSRGLSFGSIFNRAGQLVASVSQEGLIRDLDMVAR